MSGNFCYINPKNSLAKDAKINSLVAKIIQKVAEIPNHQEYKNNMELLKMVCLMVEHAIDNTGKKEKLRIDKKDIVFSVYTRIWNGFSPQDIKSLEANIAYLHENNLIIKKGMWCIVKHSVCDWFNRKILN
jgi:predicted ATP-dependent Lon-type protease